MTRIGGRIRASKEGSTDENSDFYINALARGLTILSLFDIERPEWSLIDITRHTGIPKTTAYRMLRTLECEGFVTYNPDTGLYNIGPANIPIAYLSLSYVEFSRITHPALEKLAELTGETVELAVSGKEGAVIVDQVTTSHPFKPNLPIGRVLRNLCNSDMKVFVAFMPEEERERILEQEHPALTPHSITDPVQLRAELDKVRERGLAFDIEEQELGVCAVSAPVFSSDKEIRAVLTVVAPIERFGPEQRKGNAQAVQTAAAQLSGFLK